KAAISVLWYFGSAVEAGLGRVIGRRLPARFVVLYYHTVPASARTRFGVQMDVLARHARVVRAAHSGELPRDTPCVAITFDDAFKSISEYAVPQLVERS